MAVAEQTVAALAKQLKITVSRLLSLLKEAGIAVENEEDTLTPAQKVALTKHMAAKKGGEKAGKRVFRGCLKRLFRRLKH